MAEPKNQHFVAQRVQQQWADTKGQVRCWMWRGGKLIDFPTSPKNIMSGVQLYGAEFESQFTKIENQAWPVLDKLLGDGIKSLDSEDRRTWAFFILAQLARAPDKVEWVRGMDFERVLKVRQQKNPSFTREDLRAELAASGYNWPDDPAQEGRHARIAFLMKNMRNPVFMDRWSKLEWGVLNVTEPMMLLGDEPVIFYGDLRTAHCEVYMPISPTQTFFAINPFLPSMMAMHTPERFLKMVNEHQVKQAHRHVIGNAPRSFIEKRLKKAPEPFVERYPLT